MKKTVCPLFEHACHEGNCVLANSLDGNGILLKEKFQQTYVTARPLPPNFIERPEAIRNRTHWKSWHAAWLEAEIQVLHPEVIVCPWRDRSAVPFGKTIQSQQR
jgi:hypothetical protein